MSGTDEQDLDSLTERMMSLQEDIASKDLVLGYTPAQALPRHLVQLLLP